MVRSILSARSLGEEVMHELPCALCVFDSSGTLLFANALGRDILSKLDTDEFLRTVDMEQVVAQRKTLLGHVVDIQGQRYVMHVAPVSRDANMTHILFLIDELSIYHGLLSEEMKSYKTTIDDLQTIFDNSYDVLYVSDGEGRTLRASSACEALWGKKPDELIGRTVFELEKEGVYSPSATRLALERGKKVQIVQQTSTGRRLMVVSTPIRDVSGKIVRVVNASKDITEIHELEQELHQLKGIVEGYRQQLAKWQENASASGGQLIHRSKAMGEVMSSLAKIALVDSTVLITGESGVGKELAANYIHHTGMNADKPLIKVNCAAIPESLLESELFGYESGAFTGASRNGRAGLFELANEGTLFLDEIGDMPLGLQSKLLRVLQDKEIMRIGGRKSIPVNVRILAATNQDLWSKVNQGLFRKDLYYRLNVIPVVIPALRERKEDILPLANHFLDLYGHRFNRRITLSAEVLSIFEDYSWPGNIRELQNIIERVAVTSESSVIAVESLPKQMRDASGAPASRPGSGPVRDVEVYRAIPLKDAEKLMETQLIELAARESRTLEEIAQKLGVNQSTISRKLQKHAMHIDMLQCKNA